MPNNGRVNSLLLLNSEEGRALLAQQYRVVVENIEKGTLSAVLKNNELSGDIDAGSVEAKRFANAISEQYGTAASNGLGNIIKVKPVAVPINMHREIVEPLEKYDASRLGVPDLIARRTRNHARAMIRELERAFFDIAVTEGSLFTTTDTNIEDILEGLIQSVEKTQNEFVDGVPRDMIHIVCEPAFYGKVRNYLDGKSNVNVNTAAGEFGGFHGVSVYSSVYLPAGVKCVAMVEGAVAQPVSSDVYQAREIPLTNRWSLELFYDYGTTAVMPDLIKVYTGASTNLGELDITSTKGIAAGTTAIEVNPAEGNFYYKLGTTVQAVSYGTSLSTWTALPADGIVTVTGSNTIITVAEADASTNAIAAGNAKIVKK